jgi:hypothetical protein
VLDGMSTFALDLAQIGSALRRADAHSLVIIDEFGKGTLAVCVRRACACVHVFVGGGRFIARFFY